MNLSLIVALVLLCTLNAVLLFALMFRRRNAGEIDAFRPMLESIASEVRRLEQSAREEATRGREETSRGAANLREEVANRIGHGLDSLSNRHAESQRSVEEKLQTFRAAMETQLRLFGESSDTRLARLRQELNDSHAQSRSETRSGFLEFQVCVKEALTASAQGQATQFGQFSQRLAQVNDTVTAQLDKVRLTVDGKLGELQAKNEQKLDEMRRTVDEKLEGTLEKRLGESFRLVSERLEAVHKGLGEMQVMATSVGDLKRVLTNVKARGTWGEIQLGALLEQILTAEQYMANVAPKPGSMERVEYAIRLPGRIGEEAPVWVPIDAKFPQEDYQRLMEAADRADAEGVADAGRALENRLRKQAKDISDKYIAPPHTTDFALLFLPSEALYAEVLRRPGLASALQQDHRVVIAGPTTLGALLNSLQMGFRTLAIQQRSSEVWTVLSAVKSEFGKFGEVLTNVKAKLDQASKQIEQTEVRTRAINKKLRDVQELPAAEVARLLPDAPPAADDAPDGNLDILPFARNAKVGK